MYDFLNDKRFEGIKPFKNRIHLSSPTPHMKEEMIYIEECYKTGWLTTLGENINELESIVSNYMNMGENSDAKKHAVALVNGTSAIHLAVKLAAERVYHSSTGITTPNGKGAGGSLFGRRVFVSDMTFDASVNPIVYEGGEPVFIDSEYETWNMNPESLKRAFEIYPDTKIVVFVHLYGLAGKIGDVRRICREYGAVLIEDAAESLGACTIVDGKEVPTGSVGDYGIISFNGNKIITGSSGGMLIVPDEYSYNKTKKWSTQSREAAPWYEHEELGYNYRISNVIAGIVRGQWKYLSSHIEQKKEVFERYKKDLSEFPVTVHGGGNYWLSSLLIDRDAMSSTARNGRRAVYEIVRGKSCPTEILETLNIFNAEGRPIWKPMHLQPMFRCNDYITVDGIRRGSSNAYIDCGENREVTTDIFERGLCLPSDNKMIAEEQDMVIDIIHRCFR
ncbi:MAG: aminotransferase DegT [Hungatella sp.]|nr:aminotransferase DegT [Hungatella sp.]